MIIFEINMKFFKKKYVVMFCSILISPIITFNDNLVNEIRKLLGVLYFSLIVRTAITFRNVVLRGRVMENFM